MPGEEARAETSKFRGQVASGIRDSDERRKFISRQGDEEARGKSDTESLKQDAYRQRNVNAVQGSFKRGGRVKKTGVYRLHKGERVVPRKSRRR